MAGVALRKRFTCFLRLPIEVRLLIWEFALPGARLVKIRQRPIKKTFLDFEEEHGIEWPGRDFLDFDPNEDEESDRDSLNRILSRERLYLRSEICCKSGVIGYDQRVFWNSHMLGIESNCLPPEITFVCRESYEVVSGRYTKAFAYPESITGTYFNFDLDTLYIHYHDFSYYFDHKRLYSIIDGLIGNFQLVDQESLKKVRKLAVLLPRDYESDEIDEFLDEVLDIFEGLKELFLVLRDYNYGQIPHYPPEPERVGDECIIDPLSALRALKTYSDYRHDILRGELPKLRRPMLSNANKVNADVERLKNSWAILDKADNSTCRPSIQPKAIVPPRLKKDLDLAEGLCNLALENSEIAKTRDALHAIGFDLEDIVSDDDFDDF